jgi:hypothetical protein
LKADFANNKSSADTEAYNTFIDEIETGPNWAIFKTQLKLVRVVPMLTLRHWIMTYQLRQSNFMSITRLNVKQLGEIITKYNKDTSYTKKDLLTELKTIPGFQDPVLLN